MATLKTVTCQTCGEVITGKLADHACGKPATPVPAAVMVEETLERRPIMPMTAVNRERVYTYWLWYLAPLKEPRVSTACKEWVLSGMTRPVSETQKVAWQRALAKAPTVKCDAASALTRKPGSLSTDREQYRRKGFLLCQKAEGEVGSGEFPFRAWRTDMDGGETFLGCRQIVAELKRRLPWGIAQLTAQIAETERRMAQRGISASQLEYLEDTLGTLMDKLNDLKSGSVPLADELHAFFILFDRVLLEARQDARMKEQMNVASLIAGLDLEAEQALAAARRELELAGAPA